LPLAAVFTRNTAQNQKDDVTLPVRSSRKGSRQWRDTSTSCPAAARIIRSTC
jgi:hypothetical protein